MRRVIYQALLKAPFRIASGLSTFGGLVGTLFPQRVQAVIGEGVPVQPIGIALLVASVIYFILLWLLKPGERDGGGATTVTTSGPQSPGFGTVHGNVTNYYGPPPEPDPPPQTSPWDDPNFSLFNPSPPQQTTFGDGSHNIQAGRDVHVHAPAERQERKPPGGWLASGARIQNRLRRDKPLPEGIVWVLKRRWEGSFAAEAAANMGALGKAWQDVGQAAADGHVTIWGRVSRGGKYVPIDPEFWIDHQPEWLSLINGEALTEPTEHGASTERFYELMVNRGEFMREWRPKWNRGNDDRDPGDNWKTV